MADSLEAQASPLAPRTIKTSSRARGGTSATLSQADSDHSRIAGWRGLRAIADQPDPTGEIVRGWRRPNGLLVEQVRVPLGVVAVIYEARPNVTADVSGLCLKSGNSCILRGSSIALESNKAIVQVLTRAAEDAGVPHGAIQLIPDASRAAATELMQAKGLVDLLVPRGGQALIKSIEDNATVPYIIDGDGNCHVYVDRAADLQMASTALIEAQVDELRRSLGSVAQGRAAVQGYGAGAGGTTKPGGSTGVGRGSAPQRRAV